MAKNNSWTVILEDDGQGGLIMPFPADMMAQMDWREGDLLDFNIEDNAIIVKNLSWEKRQGKDKVAES